MPDPQPDDDRAVLTMSVTGQVGAQLVGVSPTQFGMSAAAGFIPQQPTGEYLVRDCVQGYLRYRLGSGQTERAARDARLGELAIAERSLALSERRAALMNLQAAMQHCSQLLRPLFQKLIGDVPRRAFPRDQQKQQQLMKLFEEIRDEYDAEQQRKVARIKATARKGM
jgi:hypothetical protein